MFSKIIPKVFTYPSKQPFLTISLHSSAVRAIFLECLGWRVRASVGLGGGANIFCNFITFLCMFEASYLMK